MKEMINYEVIWLPSSQMYDQVQCMTIVARNKGNTNKLFDVAFAAQKRV